MNPTVPGLLDELPLEEIEAVTFYKRDEVTTDLICCEVTVAGRTLFFNEDSDGWDALIRHLQQLPGFRADWFAVVSKPVFLRSEMVAFHRGQ